MIVYGHRGARGEAPENTIAGARHAFDRGVRHLEIDLRLSANGKLVVVHDNTVKRTAGGRGKIGDFSSRELATMDARCDGPPWPNKRHTGIPTLSALVKALPGIRHWQLELKSGGKRYNEQLAAAVVDWLNRHRLNAVVTSLEPTLLSAVKQQRPVQATGFVSELSDPDAVLENCGCDHLIAHWPTLTSARQVKQWQQRGIHVSAWTVNDASVIKHLFELGVDSVITDYPSMALPLVASLQR